MLGAVLLVAQLGAFEIRSLLCSGEGDALKQVPLKERGLTEECRKVLAAAAPLEILKAIKSPQVDRLIERVLRHADDLDFLQTLITSLGNRSEVNPSLNALHEAYSRRRFSGRFKSQGQNIKLDTLLHQDKKS